MISKLQYITQEIEGKTHVHLAEEACKGGVLWIQLRVKNKSEQAWKEIALETMAVCKKHNAKLIINDNAALAKEIGADGVHLGKQDMSTSEARKILGNNFIIGGTANTFEDIKMHAESGVDYIGLGPFRFTSTKEKLSRVLGLEGYTAIMQQCQSEKINVPVISIGGITAADVGKIVSTGVYGVAVAAAITFSRNKAETINEFLLQLEETKLKML